MSHIEVNKTKCIGCNKCVEVCNYDAIKVINGKAVIDYNLCTLCGACVKACPVEAIAISQVVKKIDLSNYKGIWVIIEYFDGELKNTGFQLVSKANELARASKDAVTAVLVGNTEPAEEELKKIFSEYGVRNVKSVYHKDFTRLITEDASEVLSAQIAQDKPKIVLFLGTIFGRTLAPQVATRVQTGLTADCTELEINERNNLLQIRPTYGGKVLATIETPYSCPQMASVRPNVFIEEKMPIMVEEVKIERVPVKKRSFISVKNLKKVLKIEESDDIFDTPVEEAKIVYCIGLGVGSKEGFDAVANFARQNGAVVAATRGVVDEGWADISQQVGQTGVTIRPELYVGFGVSGAIHHIIGIKNSRKIVAINKDFRAPIFKIADYCIVADLFEVIEKMKNYSPALQ
jgi:electron transfer flavoprotein alpha subunit